MTAPGLGPISGGDRRTLPDGGRRIIEYRDGRIGIFAVDGEVYAVRDRCPHQGAPICAGRLSGTTVESPPQEVRFGRRGRILSCPWHHWEFDVTTGRSVFEPDRYRIRTYPVTVVDDEILVHVRAGTAEQGEVGSR
ncbi:MAG: Rieske (2Fe-2S) protein [Pseudonocardia sp.]